MGFGSIMDKLKKITLTIKDNRLVNIENEGNIKQAHNSNQGDVVAGNKIVTNNTFTIAQSTSTAKLSQQAEKLLQAFVESGAVTMGFSTMYETGTDLHLMFDHKHSRLELDQRLIRNNLHQLESIGYIVKAGGDLSYNLTEAAINYIGALSKSELPEQAKGILLEMSKAPDQKVFHCMEIQEVLIGNVFVRGTPKLQINGKGCDQFVAEDFALLVEKGYLSVDRGSKTNTYSLTRSGVVYAEQLQK